MLLLYSLAGGNQLLGTEDPVGLDRLAKAVFTRTVLGLQRPGWGLILPEELEDGGDQARVHKLLSQKDLVGADRLAKAALVPHLPLLLSPTQLQQVGQQLGLVPLPAPVKQWQINTRTKYCTIIIDR
jgi:hypothetical protein